MEKLRTAKRPPIDPARIEVVDWETVKLLQKMTGLQKMDLMDQIYLETRAKVELSVRAGHPDWDEDHVRAATNQELWRLHDEQGAD